MKELKQKYNHLLKRFENGCDYLAKNKDRKDRYFIELIRIVDDLGKIIDIMHKEYNYIMTSQEIREGFKEI